MLRAVIENADNINMQDGYYKQRDGNSLRKCQKKIHSIRNEESLIVSSVDLTGPRKESVNLKIGQ